MKTPHPILRLVLAGILLFAACIWLFRPSREARQLVTLATITASSAPSSNTVAFCVSNAGPRAILLIDQIVEVKTPSHWQAFSHTVPTHPQRLASGDKKDLTAGIPGGGGPWRLRVAYGTDVKGPFLLLARAEYSISHLRWAGPGFGLMAGSNSVVSAEH